MKRISVSEFKNRRVETQGGALLGFVHDLIFDEQAFRILQVDVRSSNVLKRMTQQGYLVDVESIIEVSEKKVIVADAVVQDTVLQEDEGQGAIDTSPATLSIKE
jgi:uncharacterized protein YrrD